MDLGRVDRLQAHEVALLGRTAEGIEVRLRPMTEGDWDLLLAWNNDPEVLYYAEGDEVVSRPLAEVQALYREVSQSAFCFIIEAGERPVGECWLQEMNLGRILGRYVGLDARRIDLMIGDQAWWGRGVGTAAIRLLTAFGFEEQGADMIWACDVADYNPRSRRAFERVGYRLAAEIPQPEGAKARWTYDLVMWRRTYEEAQVGQG